MERLNLKSLHGLSGITFDNYDPAAHARMKADAINSTPGSLTGIDCPKCKNRGSIALPREDGSVSVQDCDCTGSRIIEMAGGNVYAISRNTSRNYRLRNMVTV